MTRDQLAQTIIDYLAASDEEDLYSRAESLSNVTVDGEFDALDLADTILEAITPEVDPIIEKLDLEIATAPAANWAEDDYNSGYIHGLDLARTLIKEAGR